MALLLDSFASFLGTFILWNLYSLSQKLITNHLHWASLFLGIEDIAANKTKLPILRDFSIGEHALSGVHAHTHKLASLSVCPGTQ